MSVEKIAALFPGYKQGENWDIIDCPDSDVSSTVIRDWYRKGLGACADYLVSNYARCRIKRFGLFRGKPAA
jgi:hypothetical protein